MLKPYIVQYRDAIKKGYININGERKRLVVGWKIEKALDILNDYLEDPRFEFKPQQFYNTKLKFMESCCLQSHAPYYNKPLELMLWQKAFFEAIYSFYDKSTGLLLINEALLEVARKNGKSTMIAADINSDLFIGPGGLNYCIASNDNRQATIIFDELKHMRQLLDVNNKVTSDSIVEVRNNKSNIKVFKLSSKTQNKDGFNFIKAYQDEAHDCRTADIAEACKRSMSTHEQPLFITISTNGFLGPESYFAKKLDYANKWLEGETENPHYLPFLYEQDDEAEVWGTDRDMWQKANPSLIYGVKKWAYLAQKVDEAKLDSEARIHNLVKEFNIASSNAKAWLAYDVYNYEQQPFTLKDFKGCPCMAGVDLSDTGDLTAVALLFIKPDSDTKYIVTQFFIPEAKLNDQDNGANYKKWASEVNPVTGKPYIITCKGHRINQKTVADWLQSLRREFSIEPACVGYDKWNSDVFLLYCDKKTGYGFNTQPILQGPGLSFAMLTLERDLTARLVNYGDNPVLKYCFSNTSAKIINEKIAPVKMNGQYSRKIDGVVATLTAYATYDKKETLINEFLRR